MDGFSIPERLEGISPLADSPTRDRGRERSRKPAASGRPTARPAESDTESSESDIGSPELDELA